LIAHAANEPKMIQFSSKAAENFWHIFFTEEEKNERKILHRKNSP
jgi:hypothetical protein